MGYQVWVLGSERECRRLSELNILRVQFGLARFGVTAYDHCYFIVWETHDLCRKS